MDADNVHHAMDADDLYDVSFITERKCPKCGELTISHPDCTETCSNNKCEFNHIRIDC